MFQEIAGKVYRSIHEGGYVGSVTVSALSEEVHDTEIRPITISVECKHRETGDEIHLRFSASRAVAGISPSNTTMVNTLDAIVCKSDYGVRATDPIRLAQWINKDITSIISNTTSALGVEYELNKENFSLCRVYISDLDDANNLDAEATDMNQNIEYAIATNNGDIVTIEYNNDSLAEKTGSMNLDKISSDRLSWMLSIVPRVDAQIRTNIITGYSDSIFEKVSDFSNRLFVPYLLEHVCGEKSLDENKKIAEALKKVNETKDEDISEALKARANESAKQMMEEN